MGVSKKLIQQSVWRPLCYGGSFCRNVLIERFILAFGLPFLQTMSFILVIASLVQLVEMFLHKTSPALYKAMGIFLPLITTNCAILGLAIMSVQNAYTFIQAVVFALGGGLGFTLALVLLAGDPRELRFADIPEPLLCAHCSSVPACFPSC